MKLLIISLILVLSFVALEAKRNKIKSSNKLSLSVNDNTCYLMMDGGSSGVKLGFLYAENNAFQLIGGTKGKKGDQFKLQALLSTLSTATNAQDGLDKIQAEAGKLADNIVEIYKDLITYLTTAPFNEPTSEMGKKWPTTKLQNCFTQDADHRLINQKVILMATAGIRKELIEKWPIAKSKSLETQGFRYQIENQLAVAIKNSFKTKHFNPKKDSAELDVEATVDIISGTFEGVFGFLGALVANNNKNPMAINPCPDFKEECLQSAVYFENGGASIQFAFLAKPTERRRFAKLGMKGEVTLTINSKKYHLWAQSFLGPGNEELRKKLQEDKAKFKNCVTCSAVLDELSITPNTLDVKPTECLNYIKETFSGTNTDKYGDQYGPQWEKLRTALLAKLESEKKKNPSFKMKLLIKSNPLWNNVILKDNGITPTFEEILTKSNQICAPNAKQGTNEGDCGKDPFTNCNCLNGLPFIAFFQLALSDNDVNVVKARTDLFTLYIKDGYEWLNGAIWTMSQLPDPQNLLAKPGVAKVAKQNDEHSKVRVGEWPFNDLGKLSDQENTQVSVPTRRRRLNRRLRRD